MTLREVIEKFPVGSTILLENTRARRMLAALGDTAEVQGHRERSGTVELVVKWLNTRIVEDPVSNRQQNGGYPGEMFEPTNHK